MINLSEEKIPPCKICGKIWKRKDYKKWFCYKNEIFCLSHRRVEEFMEKKYREADERLKEIIKEE